MSCCLKRRIAVVWRWENAFRLFSIRYLTRYEIWRCLFNSGIWLWFKFRIPYDSCTHDCNSYHDGVPAVNSWQHCPHVHISFSSNSMWQNYWNSSNNSAFTVLSVESVILECFWCFGFDAFFHTVKGWILKICLAVYILVKKKNC